MLHNTCLLRVCSIRVNVHMKYFSLGMETVFVNLKSLHVQNDLLFKFSVLMYNLDILVHATMLVNG